jgi:putative ATP-dependent endonuclease of OLD family
VRSKLLEELEKDVDKWEDCFKLRTAIGGAAKNCDWFKDTTRGDLWFKAISPAFQDAAFVKKNLALELGTLWAWAEHV